MGRKQRNSNGKFRNGAPNNQYGYSGNNYPNNQFGDFGTDFSNGRIYDKQYGEVKKSNKGSILIGFLIGLLVMGGIGAGVLFFLNIGSNKNVTPVIKHTPTATPTPEPTATPTPEPTEIPIHSGDISVGDIITFGRYEQDNDLTNGAEPIEWNVLDVQDGKALLISKYGLDAKTYDEKSEAVTWETCTLRQWLNKDFLEESFSLEEATRIQTTTVLAKKNPKYTAAYIGNDTEDRVFLLSVKEAERYYKYEKARRCAPTKYAIAHGAYAMEAYRTMDGEATCCWWLRSPGYDDSLAACVDYGGSVDYFGTYFLNDSDCVRPALWINLAS